MFLYHHPLYTKVFFLLATNSYYIYCSMSLAWCQGDIIRSFSYFISIVLFRPVYLLLSILGCICSVSCLHNIFRRVSGVTSIFITLFFNTLLYNQIYIGWATVMSFKRRCQCALADLHRCPHYLMRFCAWSTARVDQILIWGKYNTSNYISYMYINTLVSH